MNSTARHYRLKCQDCEASLVDNGLILECPNEHSPALLISDYNGAGLTFDSEAEGLYRYRRWLPIVRELKGAGRTVTYRSERLSRITELPHLWIAFNGYWPERGAALETATFKELEAYSVLARLTREQPGILVVASAGNTAAAFASACSKNKIACLIIIPESGLHRLQYPGPLDPRVKIVSLTGFTDYYDAITLAERVSRQDGFIAEGGVKNVGRRDGLATTMLNAVERIERIPEYYFQAVGSGSGAIAVHEAAKRLIRDGRYGRSLPRLMLSQNLPFAPMYFSWKSGRRDLINIGADESKKQIQQIAAQVLSNRKPPYSIRGGVFDALKESQGDMLVADNREALAAKQLFEEAEGIDLDPASGVTFATLLKASRSGQIKHEATVLLHITGGGWRRSQLDRKLIPLRADLQVAENEISSERTLEKITQLFK
ncbi:MAG TPA: cysteate synthase [Blastocatellia bacterium]|nr:cysteate synthase [Blastocatellia bacterium]